MADARPASAPAPRSSTLLLRVLDVEVPIRIDDSARDALDEALDPLTHGEARGDRPTEWSIEPDGKRWWLRLGLSPPHHARRPEGVVGPLLHELNVVAARQSACVALHCAGVTVGTATVLLPGPMESGKSTLTAGLLASGCGYLSDEAIGLHEHGTILAYPKPLTIDEGAQHLFPTVAASAARYRAGRDASWHVPPAAFGSGYLDGARQPDLVVFPRYERGAATRGHRLSGPEAVMELASNTFRYKDRPRQSLGRLVVLARSTPCYVLVMGDLGPAVDTVLGLTAAPGL